MLVSIIVIQNDEMKEACQLKIEVKEECELFT